MKPKRGRAHRRLTILCPGCPERFRTTAKLQAHATEVHPTTVGADGAHRAVMKAVRAVQQGQKRDIPDSLLINRSQPCRFRFRDDRLHPAREVECGQPKEWPTHEKVSATDPQLPFRHAYVAPSNGRK